MTTVVKCNAVILNGLKPQFGASVLIDEDTLDLNHLTLTVAEDYYTRFRRRSFVSGTISAAEYLSKSTDKAIEGLLCQEMPVPSHLLPSIALSLPSGAAWTADAIAHVHAGRSDCATPLHFDWDLTWVANVCLTGRKRFFIFPPNAGWLLNPVLNLSGLCVPRFSEKDRRDLLAKLSGIEVVLNAGEGVLFPSLSWHGALYEEPCLSFSLRFEPSPGGRPFAALPRNWLLQRVVWEFFREGYKSAASDFLSEYLQLFFDKRDRWTGRYRSITRLCRSALSERGEAQGATALMEENFSPELALARDALNHSYSLPSSSDDLAAEKIDEAEKYIFERLNAPPQATKLASYALTQRQGLRPKRGLIKIVHA
jgi:hypothetical protein